MAKIDFTKVEKSLDLNARKMFIKKLIQLTEKEQLAEEEEKKKEKNKHMGKILRSLKKDLYRLSEKSEKLWTSLGISKKEIVRFIQNPGKLSKEDREIIGNLMEKIKEYKESTGKEIEKEVNEDIVQTERRRHEDKQINLNEKWKPI